MAISIRTRKGLTEQHDWMLRRFLHRLDKGKVDTSEVIAVLIILRAQQVSPALLDWCDTIAHPTRTKASAGNIGGLYTTGIALIHEAQFVDTFFRLRKLTVRKLPCAVFDALLEIISDLKLSLQGLGLRALQRRDDFDQYLSDLKKRYMRDGDYYQLQSTARETNLDTPFLLDMLHQLRGKRFGREPMHFDTIYSEICSVMPRLLGCGRGILRRQKHVFTLHFLCAFHQVQVIGTTSKLQNPCYLTVDSTASGHLALHFAIYQREGSTYDQRPLTREVRGSRQLMASHTYSRPYLVTDLHENEYLDKLERDDRLSGTLFRSALRVRRSSSGYVLARAIPLPLPGNRYRGDIEFPSPPLE